MKQVALDEQRHIGFGVKLLHDLAQEDPAVPEAVADLLRRATPLLARGLHPARLGSLLHRVLRLHARGDLHRGRALVRGQDALGRPAARRRCPARRSSRSSSTRAGARSTAWRCCAPGSSARATALRRATRRRCELLFALGRARRRPPHRARRPVHRAVGVRRRRAVARARGQRRRPRPPPAVPSTSTSRSAAATRTGSTSSPAGSTRAARWSAAGCARTARRARCGAARGLF